MTMPTISPQTRWHCYQCDSYFANPVKESDLDLPLCPHCMSDFVESRDSASEDGWQSEGSAEIEQMDPPSPQIPGGFANSFNPPPMMGNRATSGPASSTIRNGSGFLGMLGNVLGISPDSYVPDSSGDSRGSTIRTFQLGSSTGSGSVFGRTISFGANPRIARQPDGRVPLMDSPTDEPADQFDQWQDLPTTDLNDGTGRSRPAHGNLDLEEIIGGIFGAPAVRTGGVVFTVGRPVNEGRGGEQIRAAGSADDSTTIEGMMQALVMQLMNPQLAELPWGTRMLGIDSDEQGRLGDYVFSQEGFDGVMERLMEAAGQQNHPPPASELVIQGLPRITLDETNYSETTDRNSTCNICLEEFQIDEKVIRVPCKHIFHDSCLVPWLENNGQCPLCRFSLVAGSQVQATNDSDSNNGLENVTRGSSNPIATVLNDITSHLRGQAEGGPLDARNVESGRSPEHESPTGAHRTVSQGPFGSSVRNSDLDEVEIEHPGDDQLPTYKDDQRISQDRSPVEATTSTAYSSAIPQDYRETMRQRERELRDCNEDV